MSQHQPKAVDQASELDAQHLDDLTLDKQVLKDLQVNNDDQVQGGVLTCQTSGHAAMTATCTVSAGCRPV